MLLFLAWMQRPLGCTGFYVRGHVESTDTSPTPLGFIHHHVLRVLLYVTALRTLTSTCIGGWIACIHWIFQCTVCTSIATILGYIADPPEVRYTMVQSGVLPLDACSRSDCFLVRE